MANILLLSITGLILLQCSSAFQSLQPVGRSIRVECDGSAVPRKRQSFERCAVRSGFDDRFTRWRYLQKLLEGDEQDAEANELLYLVLQGYYDKPSPPPGEELGSPEMTADLTSKMEAALEMATDGTFDFLGSSTEVDEDLYEALEALLPDPRAEEDAYKSVWDTVMEMHGRESVKMNEQNPTAEWKMQCLIARLLVHFDFLTEGINT